MSQAKPGTEQHGLLVGATVLRLRARELAAAIERLIADAELLAQAEPAPAPRPFQVGDIVTSLDAEDGGMTGRVAYVSPNGWLAVEWQNGGRTGPAANQVRLRSEVSK